MAKNSVGGEKLMPDIYERLEEMRIRNLQRSKEVKENIFEGTSVQAKIHEDLTLIAHVLKRLAFPTSD